MWIPLFILVFVIAVIEFNIFKLIQLCIDWSHLVRSRIIILIVPSKELASHLHSIDLLTQMGVSLEQHEEGVSGEVDGISGVSVRAAAVFDFSVSAVAAVWKLTTE